MRELEWQPIEVMPDDTPVLVYGHDGITIAEKYKEEYDWRRMPIRHKGGIYQSVDGMLVLWPTHWMPLPPPPTITPVTSPQTTNEKAE